MHLHTKIDFEGRMKIAEALKKGKTVKQTAGELGVSRQTLYEELRRGGYTGKAAADYSPYTAQAARNSIQESRKERQRDRKRIIDEMSSFGYSVKQISGILGIGVKKVYQERKSGKDE